MPSKRDQWTNISIRPLITPLDTRSRPADMLPGFVRWKQNFQVSQEGQLFRRAGHERFYSNAAPSFTNHDYHHQAREVREPITLLFESTASDATRRLFLGTQSSVSQLNETTGLYEDFITAKGDVGSRWKCAELKDTLILTNDVDDIQAYQYVTDANPAAVYLDGIPELRDELNVRKAKLVIQFGGFVLVMNVVQDGERHSNRIIWCDLNSPLSWDPAATTPAPDPGDPAISSIAGFQDLDPGEIILNAAPLAGRLYVYTNRSIWWMQPSGDPTTVFQFVRPYNEPKNQTGCLAYENTLVSTGTDHYYLSRDGIYKFNLYIPTPEREEWLHRASGLIYRSVDTQLDSRYCTAPVAEYVPEARELWFSWADTTASGINNWCMVAQVDKKTADVVDTGYTVLANFRRNPVTGVSCNETQDFLGASGVDWAVKSIGTVFLREYADLTNPNDVTADLPLVATYSDVGYNSILRGLIPAGLPDRDKVIRNVAIIDDTSAQLAPCQINVRIGNHYQIVDPNNTDQTCSPKWRTLSPKTLDCTDKTTLITMAQQNLRSNQGKNFKCYERGRYLYFDISITNQGGSPAIGGDTAWNQIDFDLMPMPKPGN